MADKQRLRGAILSDGTTVASISPPPFVVELVKSNPQADQHWKDYVFSLYDFVGALAYIQNQFSAPQYTTTERDALTAVNGMIIYNTTTNQFNFYENGAWVTK